jgi:hypothetical protein
VNGISLIEMERADEGDFGRSFREDHLGHTYTISAHNTTLDLDAERVSQ